MEASALTGVLQPRGVLERRQPARLAPPPRPLPDVSRAPPRPPATRLHLEARALDRSGRAPSSLRLPPLEQYLNSMGLHWPPNLNAPAVVLNSHLSYIILSLGDGVEVV